METAGAGNQGKMKKVLSGESPISGKFLGVMGGVTRT
jgi:hypothetical protein